MIGLGFTVVLVLMTVMIALGLNRMAQVHDRLELIVHEHNVKTELLGNMRNAARERSVTLLQLSITTDPFDLDEGIMTFRGHASDFMVNRQQLDAMPMTAEEQRLLDESRGLTERAVEVQERVLDLILEGQTEEATNWLLAEAIPKQGRVLEHLDAMIGLQKEASVAAVRDTARQYRTAVVLKLVLGGAALLMGMLITLGVLRHTRRIESALFEEKERAQVTLHAIGDGVITTDLEGRIDYLNPVAEHLTGWDQEAARGQPLSRVFHIIRESTGERLHHPLTERLPDGTACTLDQEAILISTEGREHAIEEVSAPIRDRDGTTIGAALVFRDVSRAREMARELSWAATHDCLTSLANRAEFERRLAQLVATAHQENREHALLYMDLDQFKLVNDTCGHGAGDDLLCQLTSQLHSQLRESDTLARLGGDEFGVLLSNCPLVQAERIAENLRATVDSYRFEWQGRIFRVGISIGVVPVFGHTKDTAQYMSEADAACYLAKEQGRNRIHVSRAGDTELSHCQGEMNCVQRITYALQHNRFWLHGQRIVPVSSDDPAHTEILLRMVEDDGTVVLPATFIPAAERYGQMPAIDRWVIKRVLKHVANDTDTEGHFAVNLSGHSLCDRGMLDYIVEQLEQSGVDPGRICFEITETAAIANLSQASRFIRVLRGLGCQFSLDDFGTGMASFGYLKTLKIDYLKIDGSFVRNMADDRISRAMVESIHHIGRVIGVQTIAECVSHESMLDSLRLVGVDYAQGFGLHLPEPLEPCPVVVKDSPRTGSVAN
ncbi:MULTISPECIES: EAL domain-containing protein [unclassified Thioalkalivibrio]|uniref:EAL domain-containing protein n=1 Tax=unclassified Thioalkalivibrio TaxID=2621013 RepID=UPI0003689D20|nr:MULTISPECIES: EAL domain-containing protein [unclassified Thioalkalivibrio]